MNQCWSAGTPTRSIMSSCPRPPYQDLTRIVENGKLLTNAPDIWTGASRKLITSGFGLSTSSVFGSKSHTISLPRICSIPVIVVENPPSSCESGKSDTTLDDIARGLPGGVPCRLRKPNAGRMLPAFCRDASPAPHLAHRFRDERWNQVELAGIQSRAERGLQAEELKSI
jgi:hypothetical protein